MNSSPFHLQHQNQHIESKIVVALERISSAFRVLLWNESKSNSLSPIQIQILIFLLFHDLEKCKVGYLAQEFNVTKATISDSVKVLIKKQLIKKEPDTTDTRSFYIALTSEGKITAKKSASFAQSIEQPLYQLSKSQKEVLLQSLLEMIYKLNQQGIITIQRMCFTCRFYEQKNNKHFCKLLDKSLNKNDLRVDCKEHELHKVI